MSEVNRVVIPAAGWGTRFLPATKAVPKEMLPLVDQPIIHYGVEEASASGIRQVIIVTSQGKEAMEDYFLPDPELETFLKARGRASLLANIRELSSNIQISYVMQKEQLGLGHAILIAENAVGPGPFAVLLPDDVIRSQRPVLAQM
ncbi:MAG: sugar phosphate nucleotidyltransferase, partial [Dehalococcoidia bacterium]